MYSLDERYCSRHAFQYGFSAIRSNNILFGRHPYVCACNTSSTFPYVYRTQAILLCICHIRAIATQLSVFAQTPNRQLANALMIKWLNIHSLHSVTICKCEWDACEMFAYRTSHIVRRHKHIQPDGQRNIHTNDWLNTDIHKKRTHSCVPPTHQVVRNSDICLSYLSGLLLINGWHTCRTSRNVYNPLHSCWLDNYVRERPQILTTRAVEFISDLGLSSNYYDRADQTRAKVWRCKNKN